MRFGPVSQRRAGLPPQGILLRLQRRECLGEPASSSYRSLALAGQTATDRAQLTPQHPLGGQYLYVQTGGNGIVDEFHVSPNGSLAEIGSVTVAGVGGKASSPSSRFQFATDGVPGVFRGVVRRAADCRLYNFSQLCLDE